eukprot:TRINITY_DN9414_c0_g1_i1.p1 TRINITY_DN9414_c0_g1~~TRINITY_DN9414_c0_g1_i1.p1  ORF type:complete len:471 (+),score=90.08 TRINITY_DN9414_c0_g1_i1:320-1732(+)
MPNTVMSSKPRVHMLAIAIVIYCLFPLIFAQSGLLLSSLSTANVDTDLTYADHGTGAQMDLSTWRVSVSGGGWYIVGDIGKSGYDYPQQNVVIVKAGSDSAALARPVGVARMWDDRGTGGSRDGGIYSPVCPTGYGSVGSVGIYISDDDVATIANFPTLMCVHLQYLQHGSAAHLIWDDHGSGGHFDGSVWGQDAFIQGNSTLNMPFIAQSGYNPPQTFTFNATAVTVVASPSDCAADLIQQFNDLLVQMLPTVNAALPKCLPESVGDCSRGNPPKPCMETGTLWSDSTSCVYDARVYNARNLSSVLIDSMTISCSYDRYVLDVAATMQELNAYLHIDACPVCICTTFVDATCNPGDSCDIHKVNESIHGQVQLECNGDQFVAPVQVQNVNMGEVEVKVDIGVTTIDINITGDLEGTISSVLSKALNSASFPCPTSTGPPHLALQADNCTLVQLLNTIPFCVPSAKRAFW